MALKTAEGHLQAAEGATKWNKQKLKDATDKANQKVMMKHIYDFRYTV